MANNKSLSSDCYFGFRPTGADFYRQWGKNKPSEVIRILYNEV
jgi:hypothetical protein